MRPRQTPFHSIRRASLSMSEVLFENSGQYACSRLTKPAVDAAGESAPTLLSVSAGRLASTRFRRPQSRKGRPRPVFGFCSARVGITKSKTFVQRFVINLTIWIGRIGEPRDVAQREDEHGFVQTIGLLVREPPHIHNARVVARRANGKNFSNNQKRMRVALLIATDELLPLVAWLLLRD